MSCLGSSKFDSKNVEWVYLSRVTLSTAAFLRKAPIFSDSIPFGDLQFFSLSLRARSFCILKASLSLLSGSEETRTSLLSYFFKFLEVV